MIGRDRLADVARLDFGRSGSEQPRQYRSRLVLAPARDQIARTLGDQHQGHEEQRRRDHLHPEHPAPRRKPEPERIRGPAGAAGQEIVREERAGEAGDDHDLLHAREPPAQMRRRDLTDVGRGEHAGGADAHAGREARDDHHQRRAGGTGRQRAGDEQQRRDQQHVAPTPDIGQPAGAVGTERASGQQRAHGDAESAWRQAERAAQSILRAVDDSAVVAEHEAADGRDTDDCGDQRQIDPGIGLVHPAAPQARITLY